MSLTIGVDIGGTKLSGGVVDAEGNLVATTRVSSPARESAAMVEAITSLVSELCTSVPAPVSAVGLAAAGYIDLTRSTVVYAANVDWVDEPLRALVGASTGLPVVVDNDANAAAWAEYSFGAGVGARTMLMVTLGTGIGGGIVHKGALYRGGFGGAGEIGHIRLVADGRRCGCGLTGCWEAYCSGTALTRDARDLATADPSRASALLSLAGSVSEITGVHVSAAALEDDPVSVEAFDILERRLGEGLASVAAVLDPDVVVIGGGVSEAHELNLAQVLDSYTQHVSGGPDRPTPDLRIGRLGNDAGILGIAALAREVS